jgi:hypothetical protein
VPTIEELDDAVAVFHGLEQLIANRFPLFQEEK